MPGNGRGAKTDEYGPSPTEFAGTVPHLTCPAKKPTGGTQSAANPREGLSEPLRRASIAGTATASFPVPALPTMAKKLLILHGYSDGATSFTGLRDFFQANGYTRENVFLLNYASMDDQAQFSDFADKLDEDYDKQFRDERVDVACHSTGALVVRLWLDLHYRRQRADGKTKPRSPVEHLLMFAPANFGSDLAEMGQSFLGKFRSTFFNANRKPGDFLESGKYVLQGLEPASPLQWSLSGRDLHGEGFFNPELGDANVCYPFVFAAGRAYGGLQARIIKDRKKPGTDGTVRICGTSLNTRKCVVDFCHREVNPRWVEERKFGNMALAIFGAFNHGSIIDHSDAFARGPGKWALEALAINSIKGYDKFAERCDGFTRRTYRGDPYQQFFFCVRDDVGLPVRDFYIDFHAQLPDGSVHQQLTLEFDRSFETEFYRHSAEPSCRALLLNLHRLRDYFRRLKAAGARLVFDVFATSPVKEIRYLPAYAVVFDEKSSKDEPDFLFENTTTLVEVVLNRVATDQVLHLVNFDLQRIPLPPTEASTSTTGRARLIGPKPGASPKP